MKTVTAVLIVYAILAITLSIYLGWSALSKSSLAAENYTATELTGGVTDDVKADGQATDIVKSNDL